MLCVIYLEFIFFRICIIAVPEAEILLRCSMASFSGPVQYELNFANTEEQLDPTKWRMMSEYELLQFRQKRYLYLTLPSGAKGCTYKYQDTGALSRGMFIFRHNTGAHPDVFIRVLGSQEIRMSVRVEDITSGLKLVSILHDDGGSCCHFIFLQSRIVRLKDIRTRVLNRMVRSGRCSPNTPLIFVKKKEQKLV